MTAFAKLHRALAHLFAGLVVLQFGLAGWGAFKTDYDKRFSDNNFGPHALLGTFLVLLALILLLLSVAGRWSPTVTKLSGGLFVLMVVQFILGVTGASSSPFFGVLHGMNALVIAFLTYLLVRATRALAATAVPPVATNAPASRLDRV